MIDAIMLCSLLSISASRSGKDYSNIEFAVDRFVSAANRLAVDTPCSFVAGQMCKRVGGSE
jgi:hypothetical protein